MFNPHSQLLYEFWEKGCSSECPIIDLHAHMNPHVGSFQPENSAAGMVSRMERCNTILTLFSCHDALFMPGRHQEEIKAVKQFPDRLRAYFVINGNAPDIKAELKLLEDYPDVFVGLKNLTGYTGLGILDQAYEPFYEYANAHRMPVLCHTWGGGLLNEAETLLARYPELILIAGHSFHGAWKDAAKLAAVCPNLYLELTAVIDEVGPLEILLEHGGSEKIVFGTDLPWFDTLHGVGYIFSTPMSDDERKNILFRNGLRIFGQHEWFRPFRPANM